MQTVSRVKMSFLKRAEMGGVENVCIHQNKMFFIAPAFVSPLALQKEISVYKAVLFQSVYIVLWIMIIEAVYKVRQCKRSPNNPLF